MRIASGFISSLLVLGACGDPLAGVERVSDGAVLPDAAVTTALPTDEELAREDSILSGLFRTPTETTVAPAVGALPVRDATDTAEGAATDQAAGSPPAIAAGPMPVTASTPSERRRKGIFGWLRRASISKSTPLADDGGNEDTNNGVGPDVGGANGTDPQAQDEEIASLAPESVTVTATPDLVAPGKRRRLFGRDSPAQTAGMVLRDVGPGAVLPFGEVARVCNVDRRALGTIVERAARKGSGYDLYDSAPDSAEPRSFYVTGFGDNCARQFTAALAIFGTPESHEHLRYGLPAEEYPYSSTDRAYEKVKASVCNVGRNTPCGARVSRLRKTTVFVSVYENFGENARWADMLLHDGALLATSVKTP